METISQAANNSLAMMKSEHKTERWRKIIPMLEKDLKDFGIDSNEPQNWIVYVAKTITREAKKGILLMGTVGRGKTKRMKFLRETGIDMIPAREFGDVWSQSEKNPDEFREFCRCIPPRWDSVPKTYNDLIIDDLGTESEKYVAYGNQRDVMRDEVLPMRYEMFISHGAKTHISTNLTEAQLKERYGERIYSRLSEMCAFVSLIGEDRRMHHG